MWQEDDQISAEQKGRPEPWAALRRRLDQRLVNAYCALRFDRHTSEQVMRDHELDVVELVTAIRRGAKVYGHDVDEAIARFAPKIELAPTTGATPEPGSSGRDRAKTPAVRVS